MRHRFLTGLVVVIGLVGAGCGGDDEGDGDNGGGAGTTPAAGASGGGAGAAAGSGGGDMACVTQFMTQGGQTEACAMCACTMCMTELANLEALTAADRVLADAVIDCSRQNCCSGTPCYCGATDLATCAAAMPAAGPCVPEIEAAAKAMGLAMIAGPAMMPTSALGAPSALGRCLNGDGAMVAGKCAACAPTCN